MRPVSTFRTVLFLILVLLLYAPCARARQPSPLEGLQLRCCSLIESPITFQTGILQQNSGFGGLAIDYFNILQKRLGFECSSHKLFNATNPENQGFTGFIIEMEQCTTENGTIRDDPDCQCDVGVGGWVRDSFRLGRVDFVPSFLNYDYRMLTHVDNVSRRASGAFFLVAFSPGAWAAIAGLLMFFIFLKLCDKRFSPPRRKFEPLKDGSWYRKRKHFLLKSPVPFRIRRATQSVLKWLLGQPSSEIEGDSKSTRQWILNFILLLSGLFLLLIYESVMTASLVQESIESEFSSVADLKSCRVPGKDICITKGGASAHFWERAIAPSTCHNEEGASKPQFLDTYEEGTRRVASQDCKFFLGSGPLTEDAANGRYCGTAMTTGQPFFNGGVSVVLPRGSNLTRILSKETLDLRIEDALETSHQYFVIRGLCPSRTDISLTLRRLRIFFFMAYGACLLLLITMVCDPHGIREQDNVKPDEKCSAQKYDDFDMSTCDDSIDYDLREKNETPGLQKGCNLWV